MRRLIRPKSFNSLATSKEEDFPSYEDILIHVEKKIKDELKSNQDDE